MDACLVIIGLDSGTAPLAVRQRFRMTGTQVEHALLQLSGMQGVTEAAVLATADRTDFILWTSDFSAAANSVLTFLTRAYELRLCDWQHFHRLLGDDALFHLFRICTGVGAAVPGDPQGGEDVKAAWLAARQAGTSGPLLDEIFDRALQVARRAQREIAFSQSRHEGDTARAIATAEALISAELRDFCKYAPSERAIAAR